MAQKTTDPKDTIRRLFEALAITRVIYVDDVFAITRESVQAQCNDLSLTELEESGVFRDVDFTIDDEDIVRARVVACVERFDAGELAAAAPVLTGAVGRGDAVPDFEVVAKFEELLVGFDLLRLSRAGWLAQKMQLLSETPPAQTLFVFDEDFRGEGRAADEGRRLVAELQRELGEDGASIALLTHTVADELSELQLQDSIAEVLPELKERLIVIGKTRLSQEQEGFAWRIKLAVLSRYFKQLKDRLQQAVATASTVAGDMVCQLHVDAFERIVFRSSSIEGVWAPETLVRIFGIHFERSVSGSLRGAESVHQLAEKASQISCVETAATSKKTLANARELQKTGIYIAANDLNPLYLPIELGDIFAAERQEFALIAQPCDLMVRPLGFRKDRTNDCRNIITLARIRHPKRADWSPKDYEFELPFFDDRDDFLAIVKFTEAYVLPTWLLDLATLDADGRCRMKADQQASPLLIPAWRQRHQILLDQVRACVEVYQAVQPATREHEREIVRSQLGIPPGMAVTPAIEPTDTSLDSDWCLSVGLRRIARLREPYASAMLTKYGHWMTRPAYPHDLTRLD